MKPPLPATARAYYIGHLGKYVPGKAWALLLRVTLIRPAGVPAGLATLTTLYEVLVTMASGVLLAVVLFAVCAPVRDGVDFSVVAQLVRREGDTADIIDRNTAVALSLLVLMPVLGPILPPVFNRLVHRLSLPFRDRNTPATALSWAAWAEGLGLTGCGWPLLGLSLAVALYAGPVGDLQLSDIPPAFVGRLIAVMGLAYVLGFVIPIPGGVGVREFALRLFLTPELAVLLHKDHDAAKAVAVQTGIILRLVMTAAELVMAAVVYWFRPTPPPLAA